MNIQEILAILVNLNWQAILAIFAVNWIFYSKLKKHQDMQDDRMFQLATGKSLADAIKEERMKKGE